MIYNQAFADYMREKMGSRSQRGLAVKVGVSQTTIGNYLLGRRPDPAIIPKLADALGVSEQELRAAAGYNQTQINSLADVTEQTIHHLNMLKGKKRPSAEELEESRRRILEQYERMIEDETTNNS